MKNFPELSLLEKLADRSSRFGQVRVAESVDFRGNPYPVYSFAFGSRSPDAPVFGLVGGVHGLEKIGTQVVLSFLDHLLERMEWDEGLRWQLEKMRFILMPLVNPVGMHRNTRANGNDVDLMRNSPVRSLQGATPLLGGHRLSRLLPWYMGEEGKLEAEAKALCDFIRQECFSSKSSVVVDVHSGFGLADQIWFPYAHSTDPYPGLPDVAALKALLDRVLPNHIYRFEPQAINYTTHGDLWDYLYDEHGVSGAKDSVFVPLTLELGSWNWIKKNPFQLYYRSGAFNPMKIHRQKRVLRRHLPFFDFLMHASAFPAKWRLEPGSVREEFRQLGMRYWYQHLLPAPALGSVR
ncbi:MAG: M14 family zinc carboxypeptidase [Oligoflexia bacterium]|nr:M14 family zinc carboxypeptidase [Oligoflexia bacterium]